MASTCVFGSIARKRADHVSDKDVLVVGQSVSELLEAAREWSSSGWSISDFTHEQILDMASRGSLFLQHLKQEGIIIRDDGGFLNSVISRFSPRLDYSDEAYDSAALIYDLGRVQREYWPMLCAADIAYGAVRNIAILKLASQGRYLFDYSDLINCFASQINLSEKNLSALHELRILKHGYRNRLPNLRPECILSDALDGADQLFGRSLHRTAIACPISGYHGLRLLELYLVTKADPRELDLLPPDDPLQDTWALIRNPRGYRPKPRLADQSWLCGQYLIAQKRFDKGMN